MQTRVYVKVRRGWNHLYFGFFFAGTAQEDTVALEVDSVLNRYQDAIASVSEPCAGAMAGFPVIGEFPRFGSPDAPKLAKPTPFTDTQRALLVSMLDGAPKRLVYKQILSGRALLGKGYTEHVEGKPDNEWWLRITDAGREKVAEMSASGQVH